MSIRALITSGDLSIEEGILYSERLTRAFEEVWRRYHKRAASGWRARRTRLYDRINGRNPNGEAETMAKDAIGQLVHESGCPATAAREITAALSVDWKLVRNTANLTLAILD